MTSLADWLFYAGAILAIVSLLAWWAEIERRRAGAPRYRGRTAVQYAQDVVVVSATLLILFALATEGRGCAARAPCPLDSASDCAEHWN